MSILTIRDDVTGLAIQHSKTWRDKPESYWLARLMQEVGELGSSLVGDHDDPPEWELKQIAAICLNWIDMRQTNEKIDEKTWTERAHL